MSKITLLSVLILACIAPYVQGGPLLVSSQGGNSVLAFDSTTGAPLGVFASGGGLSSPLGLTFGPDNNLYVVSQGSNSVLRCNGVTGAFMGVFASGNGLDNPYTSTFGPDGNLYVGSANTDNVVRFNGTTGAPL